MAPHEPVWVAVLVLRGWPSRVHGSRAVCAGGQAFAAAGLLLVPVALLGHGAPGGPGGQVEVEGQQQSEATLQLREAAPDLRGHLCEDRLGSLGPRGSGVQERTQDTPPPPPQAAPRKPVPEKKLPPTAHVPNQHRRRPPTWRAFTRLSREEQLKLLELQRSDPDQFKKILQSKADEIYKQEATRKKELDQLTEKIKSSKDPVEKERLKKVLRTKLKEDFQLRLNDTRKDIDAYKRHTARLEAELQKREKNCDAIVDAILNRRLTEKNATRPGNKPEKK